MPWVKLDDSFFSHPKVVNAGHEAIGLFTMSICYSAHHLLDGNVPEAWVKQQAGSRAKKLTAVLVEHGLWEPHGTGCVIHDFLDYNPSKEEVEIKRTWDIKRKALFQDRDLIAAIKLRDQGRCRYCGTEVNWKDRKGKRGACYDHVVPRGDNTLENVVVACRECNGVKGARTPEQADMPLLPAGSTQIGSRS